MNICKYRNARISTTQRAIFINLFAVKIEINFIIRHLIQIFSKIKDMDFLSKIFYFNELEKKICLKIIRDEEDLTESKLQA